MFKKQKSITLSNSTMVKYKITCAKNNPKIRNEFVQFQFVFKMLALFLCIQINVFVFFFTEVEV